MPIIGSVGRRSFKVRLLNGTIHAVLILGGITMVYPFLVMLAGSVKSPVDRTTLEVIPSYLYDDDELYKKYLEAKYNERAVFYQYSTRKKILKWQDDVGLPKNPVETRNRDWNEFLDKTLKTSLDDDFYALGHSTAEKMVPELQWRFRQELKAEEDVKGSIEALNKKYNMEFEAWGVITVPTTGVLKRNEAVAYNPFIWRAIHFIRRQSRDSFLFKSLDAGFVMDYLGPNYTRDIRELNKTLGTDYRLWREVCLPQTAPETGHPLREAWIDYVRNKLNIPFVAVTEDARPDFQRMLKKKYENNVALLNERWGYKSFDELAGDYENDVELFNERQGTSYGSFEELAEDCESKIESANKRWGPSYESFDQVTLPKGPPRQGVIKADWIEFITLEKKKKKEEGKAAPPPEGDEEKIVAKVEHLRIRSVELMYRAFLRDKYHSDIEKFNDAQGFGLKSPDELKLSESYPDENITFQDDWYDFAFTVAEPEWVYASNAALLSYRDLLTKPFKEEVKVTDKADKPVMDPQTGKQKEKTVIHWDRLNEEYGTSYTNEEDIQLPARFPRELRLREIWWTFLKDHCKPALLRLHAEKAATAWKTFITDKYGTAQKLNEAYGLRYRTFDTVAMPLITTDYYAFKQNRKHILWEFLTRNYRIILDEMWSSGYAIRNTVIYCFLAVAAALLVNPLAAYALSRYKPPSAYKILLFFMLTMAFPPMVLGIPNFLLIRKLGLLNTFAALILPGLANGYSIFLLKGFFDSLPRELYESASLDGASEWTMFWKITMATSKPILAVIGLSAFTVAYGNFMMAFILCQNPKMWTMMVHVYQILQRFTPDVGYAAIVIAAVPTFLVFVFCQNIIIRGIVVPTEK